MKSSLTLDERVDRAVDNFMAGYGCCQSVVAAFSDLYGLDETMAKRIAGDRRDVVTIRGTGLIPMIPSGMFILRFSAIFLELTKKMTIFAKILFFY